MIKRIALSIALITVYATLVLGENPSWIRKNAISPDGKSLAFSYKGDIYTVPADGGEAKAITSNDSYDSDPMWSPDGKYIVFTSYREGTKDIFRTEAKGGTPVTLTALPGNESPLAVMEDGTVLFTWYYDNMADPRFDGFPGDPQLWETNLDGGLPRRLSSMTFSAISGEKDRFLYEDYKGYEDPLRKHHTSSVTRDIWLYENGSHRKLTAYNGEDRNPVLCADKDTYYYLSEQDGKTINIWRSSISNPAKAEKITSYETDPVRFLSVSKDGTVAYSWNGDLYTIKKGGAPVKVPVTLNRDNRERPRIEMTVGNGASGMALSPDSKEIALVIRGDIFVTSTEYKTTRRITNTPGQERTPCFSKDGRELFYAAERDGHWGIWKTSIVNKEDPVFTYAGALKEERVTKEGETCFQPLVSPDGKWLSFYRDRTELVVMNLKSGSEKSLFKDVNYSYTDGDQDCEWSPDSRFILCNWQKDGGWLNEDVALIDIGSGEITDLTQSGYSDGNFKWAMGGKAMTWESDRYGFRSHGSWGSEGDIFIMFFDGEAYTKFLQSEEDEALEKLRAGEPKKEKKDSTNNKKPEKLDPDLAAREDRIVRLTPHAGHIGDFYLDPKGRTLYFTQQLENGMDLCAKDIRKGDIKIIKKDVFGRIVPSKDSKAIFIFSGQGITKINLADKKPSPVSYSGEFELKPALEREYIFEHVWKQVQEKFYDPGLHGIPWQRLHNNYKQFLPHIDNDFDFQDMLSELLGELNGSHTGARYYPKSGASIAHLGVLYDTDHKGDGLKIKEVLPGGTLSNAIPGIAEGDIILEIDGNEIKEGTNWFELLRNKAGKQLLLLVKTGGKKKTVTVTPSTSDSALLYKRWVRQREQKVAELSGGKIGYVHIEGMNSPSFREMYSKALGKYRNCKALIVDTRHNGGGWLHDDLVTFLGGKEYCLFTPRGQYIGHEPANKWSKPSCVLIGEDNYSDACGFPFAYRALGLGKLIGAPVPGTMTAVWWERQINPQIVFGIPQVGNWSVKDQRYIENFQIEPDILVYNEPGSMNEGRDMQLEEAVKLMLKEIE